MHIVLTIIQVIASVAIIGLVLLQRGKGADAGAGFGAGASGTVFGAKGATTALSRATAIFAAIFMLNSLALAYMGTRTAAEQQPKGFLDQAATPDTNAKKGANPAGGAPAPVTTVPSTTSAPPPATAPAEAPATGNAAPAQAAPAPSSAPAAPASPTPAAPK